MSRAVSHHWMSAGVAQLIVRVAPVHGVQWMNSQAEMMKCFWSTGSLARDHVCVAASKPKLARHPSRSSFSEAVMHPFQKRQGIDLMPAGDVCKGRCAPNQSLERMPAKHGCFALSDVSGHRSAHRWGIDRGVSFRGVHGEK